LPQFHDHVVEVRGKSYLPQKTYEASHYADPKEFTASDGSRYKWKGEKKVWELLTQDRAQTVVALCNHDNISIYSQAVNIVDEVIVTLVYMRQASEDEAGDALAAGLVGGSA